MSEIKVDKISPETGTAFTIGDSGDTFTVPSGATIVNSGTATGFGGGGLLQIKQAVKTDTFDSNSTSYVDVTGMTIDISPTLSTSKILILMNTTMAATAAYTYALALIRDSTQIYLGDAAGDRVRAAYGTQTASGRKIYSSTATFIDAPATTSATTYKLQVLMETGGTGYLNQTVDTVDGYAYTRTASSITAIELAVGVL